jgi:hypothetical protein
MNLSRRRFLKLVSAAIAAGATIPALAKHRAPYVRVGEGVSYIGHHPGGFAGSQIVHKIGQWDGVGYPVLLWNNALGRNRALERYYDFDLSDFFRDVPRDFWHHQAVREKYPNVHTWVREQRFGETMIEAMRKLNFVCIKPPITS